MTVLWFVQRLYNHWQYTDLRSYKSHSILSSLLIIEKEKQYSSNNISDFVFTNTSFKYIGFTLGYDDGRTVGVVRHGTEYNGYQYNQFNSFIDIDTMMANCQDYLSVKTAYLANNINVDMS